MRSRKDVRENSYGLRQGQPRCSMDPTALTRVIMPRRMLLTWVFCDETTMFCKWTTKNLRRGQHGEKYEFIAKVRNEMKKGI